MKKESLIGYLVPGLFILAGIKDFFLGSSDNGIIFICLGLFYIKIIILEYELDSIKLKKESKK